MHSPSSSPSPLQCSPFRSLVAHPLLQKPSATPLRFQTLSSLLFLLQSTKLGMMSPLRTPALLLLQGLFFFFFERKKGIFLGGQLISLICPGAKLTTLKGDNLRKSLTQLFFFLSLEREKNKEGVWLMHDFAVGGRLFSFFFFSPLFEYRC